MPASACWTTAWLLATAARAASSVRLRLIDLRLEGRGIDPRDQLALGDLGVEVGEQGQNVARHLRAHLHGDDRVRVAGGRDGDVDVAVFDGRRPVLSPGLTCERGPRHQPGQALEIATARTVVFVFIFMALSVRRIAPYSAPRVAQWPIGPEDPRPGICRPPTA